MSISRSRSRRTGCATGSTPSCARCRSRSSAPRWSSDDFHARFSCIGRRYLYRIVNRRAPLALEAGRAWRVPVVLYADEMNKAAQVLVGQHDFTTFRSAHCQSDSPVKTLDRLTVRRLGEMIEIEAAARSFLHHQVRSMVGCLELVGRGKWTQGGSEGGAGGARPGRAGLQRAARRALFRRGAVSGRALTAPSPNSRCSDFSSISSCQSSRPWSERPRRCASARRRDRGGVEPAGLGQRRALRRSPPPPRPAGRGTRRETGVTKPILRRCRISCGRREASARFISHLPCRRAAASAPAAARRIRPGDGRATARAPPG